MSGLGKFVLLAFCIGGLLPVQAGVNAMLAHAAGNPFTAAAINFMVGGACILVVLALLRVPLPQATLFSTTPWYFWIGGALGISMVVTAIVVGPKLGAGTMIALFIAGQMAASMLLDHYGWLGYPEHHVSPMRIIGAVLLITGVLLIRRF